MPALEAELNHSQWRRIAACERRGIEPTQKWLRAAPAAAYVGLTASTMAKMRCRGDGPMFTRAGRVILYSREDLEAWLISRRVTSTTEAQNANASR